MNIVEKSDLQHLRRELADRLDERPMETWSFGLLRAVIATIDLDLERPLVPPEPRHRRLRLIR